LAVENQMLREGHFGHGLLVYGFIEVLHEVVGIHPKNDGDTIQKEHIQMLVFVVGFEGL